MARIDAGDDLFVPGNGGTQLGVFTTTTTGTWVTAYGPISLTLPTSTVLFDVLLNLAIGHTVADAHAGLWIGLYSAGGVAPSQVITYIDNFRLPNANAWAPVSSWLGSSYPDAAGITGGSRELYVIVKNYTAGTLQLGQGLGYEFIRWKVAGKP